MFLYELSPALLRQVRRHPALPRAPGDLEQVSATFLDTPGDLLGRQGLALARVRQGWEWRLEVYDQAGPEAWGEQGWGKLLGSRLCGPSGYDFSAVDGRRLRQQLEEAAGELVPLWSETASRESLLVQTAAGPARLVLERLELHDLRSGQAHGQECSQERQPGRHLSRARLRILAGGQPESAYLLARALLGEFDLAPAPRTGAERLGTLAAATAPLRSIKAKPSLPPGPARQDGALAFRHIVRNCLLHLQQNLPGLLASDEPEFVHQARVAIRRLRSALKLFAPWLPPAFVEEFGGRWRDLANALGDCRNLDVFLAETLPLLARDLPGEPVLVRLEAAARRRCGSARRQARQVLAAPAARLLLLDFEWALARLEFPPDLPPLPRIAAKRLVQRARQVTRLGQAVRDLDPEARHELRIAFKKLRYALEFFADLFGPRRSARYLAGLVDLQEVLGHLNDLATAQGLVAGLLPASAARLPQAWLAGRSGALVDALPVAVGHFLDAEPPWKTPAKT